MAVQNRLTTGDRLLVWGFKVKKVMKVEEYLNSVLMIFLVYNSLQGTLIYIALHD